MTNNGKDGMIAGFHRTMSMALMDSNEESRDGACPIYSVMAGVPMPCVGECAWAMDDGSCAVSDLVHSLDAIVQCLASNR